MKIINILQNVKLNNLPVIGGTITPLLTINFGTAIETVFYAALGAVTGLLIKKIDAYIKKKKEEKRAKNAL